MRASDDAESAINTRLHHAPPNLKERQDISFSFSAASVGQAEAPRTNVSSATAAIIARLSHTTTRGTPLNAPKSASSFIVHDTPVPARESEHVWGSDAVAAVLREFEIPYISLVPGSSYRGLHDSIVNYLGNRAPQMV